MDIEENTTIGLFIANKKNALHSMKGEYKFMKKKAIKLATSTAIAASAFVAAAPAEKADAAVNVDQLVKAAEATAKVLQWSISTEGTANFVDRPYTAYNAAKAANKAAKAEVAKLAGADKAVYEARLLDSDLQIKRAQGYIDALTSGEKIRDKQAALDKAIKAADLKAVQSSYHVLTAEIRKQAELLYKVYGQSTRDGILKTFKDPAEKLYRSVINEVTVLDHVALVDKYTKEGKLDKATEHLAKAEDALANVKQLKSELTTNVNDVANALPLDVTSIARVDKNTVTVKFTKAVENVVATSDFVFDNGLVVTQAELSSDKKSVTLTTNTLKDNTTYTLTYRGKEVAAKLVTPKSQDTSNLVGSKDLSRLELKNTRVYSVDVKDEKGRTYTGDVKIELFSDEDYTEPVAESTYSYISNIDGVKQDTGTGHDLEDADEGTEALTVNVGVDGKVVFVVTGAGDVTNAVYPKITRVEDKESLKLGGTIFYKVAEDTPDAEFAGDEAFGSDDFDYVDTTNNYVVAQGVKYKFDDNDTFIIEGKIVSLSDFAKALTDGDEFTIDYKKDKALNSVWNITADADHKGTSIDKFTKAITVDSSSVSLTGKGQPGSKVYVFSSDDNTYDHDGTDKLVSGPITVNSNGTWSATVTTLKRNASNHFLTVQVNSGQTLADYNNVDTDNANVSYTSAINYGLFTASVIDFDDVKDNGIGINDTLTFTFNNAEFNHKFKDQKSTLVIDDTKGNTATITVKVTGDDELTITDITKNKDFDNGAGEFIIRSVSKDLVNQDGLKFQLADKTQTTATNTITVTP